MATPPSLPTMCRDYLAAYCNSLCTLGMKPWCEVKRFVSWMAATLVLLLVLIHVADWMDPKATTCGHLAPTYHYRFVNHVDPVLRPLWLATMAVFLIASAVSYYRHAQLPIHTLKHPAWPWLLRTAIIVGGLYAAVVIAPWFVPSSYPMCSIHHPSQDVIDASSVFWEGDFAPPIRSGNGSAIVAQPRQTVLAEVDFHPPHPNLDVLMVAVKPTCINNASVLYVLAHLQPRRLFIATPARHCATFEAYHPKVS